MDSKQVTRLRGWIRRYGDPGVLSVGCYVGLHHLWTKRRAALLASVLLLTCWAVMFMPSAHNRHLRHASVRTVAAPSPLDPNQALLTAVRHNDLAAVSDALHRGADVNSVDAHGNTPLILAAARASEEIVRLLLQQGAAVNKTNQDGVTAVWFAVAHNQVAAVRLLLSRKANVTNPVILGQAAIHGNNDIVRLLLAHGAKADAWYSSSNSVGTTALIEASGHDQRSTIDLLLAHGADINDCGRFGTALTFAAERGDLPQIRFLLARGADPNMEDAYRTVLAAAVEHPDVVRYLLRHGAEVDEPGKWDVTPLNRAAFLGAVTSLKILLAYGAEIDRPSEEGDTPLMTAVREGHLQVVRTLILWGADINRRTRHPHDGDDGNRSALEIAEAEGKTEIVHLLRQAGAGD